MKRQTPNEEKVLLKVSTKTSTSFVGGQRKILCQGFSNDSVQIPGRKFIGIGNTILSTILLSMDRDSESFNEKDKLPTDVFCPLKDLYPHGAGSFFRFRRQRLIPSVCPVRTDLSGNDRSRNERVLVKSRLLSPTPSFVAAIFCSFSPRSLLRCNVNIRSKGNP